MDLRQIMYFMWVYEENSFTRAAQKAGVVQPALSIQVKRLEEEFGVQLFERGSRGVEPTAFGRSFYELCAPIRRDVGLARSKMLELAHSDQSMGKLRCGFPPTFFKAIISDIVPNFLEHHPKIELELKEGYARSLSEWLMKGELDFAIGSWSVDLAGLEYSMIHEEEIVLISGAPIAGEQFEPCDISRLEGVKLMVPSPLQILGPILRQHIASGLIRPSQIMTVDSYLGVLEIARRSDWAAFVPVTGLLGEVASTDLYIYPISRSFLSFRWHVLHEEGKPLTQAARIFVDGIANELDAKKRRWSESVAARRAGTRLDAKKQ
jgi:DNA-binding transcriptional LysR family regulator